METGCSGGQGSLRAVAPTGRHIYYVPEMCNIFNPPGPSLIEPHKIWQEAVIMMVFIETFSSSSSTLPCSQHTLN
jgi:hypothetical protein